MKQKLKRTWGLWRSRLMYRYRPGVNRKLKRFYRQFVRPGDVCFDIGAHLGNRMKVWLDLGASLVVGLEPNPYLFKELMQEFGLDNRVILLNKAAGAEDGHAEFHVSYLTPTISTMADAYWREQIRKHAASEVEWNETINVDVVTLDDLAGTFGSPSFIRVHTGGMEAEVLTGLHEPARGVSFEYHPALPDAWGRSMRILRNLGDYEFNWSFGESLTFNSERWLTYDELYDILEEYTFDDPSGEIYARLREG